MKKREGQNPVSPESLGGACFWKFLVGGFESPWTKLVKRGTWGLLLLLLWIAPARAEIVDRIVAVVNEEIITLSELDEACLPLFRKYLAGVRDPLEESEIVRKIRRQVLERLIEEKLIAQEVKKYHIEVGEEEVDQFIQNVKAQIGGEEALQEYLKAQGLSLSEYRKRVKEQLKKLKLVQGSLRARIVITEEDLKRYYQKHYLSDQNRLYWLALIVNSSPEKIHEAFKALKGGADFKAVAQKYSELPEGAQGQSFKYEELSPAVKKALAQLKPGEISPPIQVGGKWQIVKILKIENKPAVPFEKVKEKIRQTLFQEELDATFKKWINELKERAFIKVLL